MPERTMTNRYFGVRQSPRLLDDKWFAYHGRLLLGSYNTPEEAAIAHNHAALLLRGATAPPNIVPPEKLPSLERQTAIKLAVENRLYRRNPIELFIGAPDPALPPSQKRKTATSRYAGVSFHRPTNKWRSVIPWSGRELSLGAYDSEHEAAFAYNCAFQLLDNQFTQPNVIPPESLPETERRTQIQGLVELRLQRSGVLGPNTRVPDRWVSVSGASAKTGYRGVNEANGGRQYETHIIYNNRSCQIGSYPSKHEAAWAFNHAILILHADYVPVNVIANEFLPAPERQDLRNCA